MGTLPAQPGHTGQIIYQVITIFFPYAFTQVNQSENMLKREENNVDNSCMVACPRHVRDK